MGFRDTGSRIDNAAGAVELFRFQRTRLGNAREVFNGANDPLIIQWRSGSRRGFTCT